MKEEVLEVVEHAGGRLPPHSMEGEQGVLACILLEPIASLAACVESLRGGPMAFYDLRHRKVFEALAEMGRDRVGIDLITIPNRLKSMGVLEEVGGVAYLSTLMDAAPSAANLSYYVDILNEKFLARRCLQIADQLQAEVWRAVAIGEVVGRASHGLTELALAQSTGKDRFVRLAEHLPGIIDDIENFHNGRKRMEGLSTGMFYLDNIMSGLRPEKLIVLGGRPGSGKTQLAMQITEQVGVDDMLPVGWFSVEMSGRQLAERIVFMRARVNPVKFRNGFLSNRERDLKSLADCVPAVRDAPIHVLDSPGISLDRLQVQARRACVEYGLRLIVVDYVQLLTGWEGKRYQSGATGNEAKIADAMECICNLKKELKIPWIVLSQLNDRDLDQAIRPPTMGDLKGSGSIEQSADAIWLFHQPDVRKAMELIGELAQDPEVYKGVKGMRWWYGDNFLTEMNHRMADREFKSEWPSHLTPMELIVAKQRDGATGKSEMVRVNPWQRFIEPYRGKKNSGSSSVADRADGPPIDDEELPVVLRTANI